MLLDAIMALNKIRCKKCGDVLTSDSIHEYSQCKCGAIAIDGGGQYFKRIGNKEDWEELSMTEKEIKSTAKEKFSNAVEGLEL